MHMDSDRKTININKALLFSKRESIVVKRMPDS